MTRARFHRLDMLERTGARGEGTGLHASKLTQTAHTTSDGFKAKLTPSRTVSACFGETQRSNVRVKMSPDHDSSTICWKSKNHPRRINLAIGDKWQTASAVKLEHMLPGAW